MPSTLQQNSPAESEAKSLGVLEKILENFTVQEFMIIFKTWCFFGIKKCRQNRLSFRFLKKITECTQCSV